METETRFWALLEAAWTRCGPDADRSGRTHPHRPAPWRQPPLMLADMAQRASG